MFLINGTWQQTLAADDRAIQFGDGSFTTAHVIDGEVRHLQAHLDRLALACERLAITAPDFTVLRDEMQQVAQPHQHAVLKVIITRGVGGRGYNPSGCHSPNRLLSVSPYPAFYAQWREEGVSLIQSPVQLGRNPFLAGLKHLNRLEQVMIRQHLAQSDAQEALVLDSEGWLTECCAANLFWRKGDRVLTPRLDQAGVNGIMRQHIMTVLAGTRWRVEEVRALLSDLASADEVFICNALMPIIPVKQAMQTCYTSRELYHFLSPLCE